MNFIEYIRVPTPSLFTFVESVFLFLTSGQSFLLFTEIAFNKSLTIDEVVSQNTSPAGKSVLVCPLLAFQAGFFRLQ